MNAVEFAGVTLGLAGRTILAQVNLAIAPQEFVGVLGPNGAGKTTLMRSILGLVAPTRGTIRVLGETASRGNPLVGYMPQNRDRAAGLGLCGWDFVAAALRGGRWGLPVLSKRDRREVDAALDLVEARELAARPLGELSGGERQRLLLAQALLGRPRLLLLDEPLLSLDPHHQQTVVSLVKQLQREVGATVLFSAHELNPLLDALDRVLYLGNGQVVIGLTEEVITGAVLSRLYGSPIDVMRMDGRIFVMSGAFEVERDHHRHI
jgi:zinc/manganese transport system ATP-binding protein